MIQNNSKKHFAVPDGSAIEKWMPVWNQLAFAFFLSSTVFMVLFSVLATRGWPAPYNHLSIGLAALGPVSMSFLPLLYRTKISRRWFDATASFLLLVFLAYLNSINSPAQMQSLKAMGLFLLSGPVGFWAGGVFFIEEKNRKIFLWVLSGILLTLLFLGYYLELTEGAHLVFSPDYYTLTFSSYNYPDFAWYRFVFFSRFKDEIVLTLSNPIPAGSALLLLLAGPLLLISQKTSSTLKIFFGFLLVADAGLILIIGKKGSLLALFVIAFIALLWHPHWIKRIFIGLLIIGVIAWSLKPGLINDYIRGFTDSASYGLRLESWKFGFEVFLIDPLIGAGFNAPLSEWLQGYTPIGDDQVFIEHLRINNTLENIFLTMLVEMGLLFVLGYGLFLWPVVKGSLRCFKVNLSSLALMACIVGFGFHSLTFDSLRNPALNWLFHTLLAFLTALFAENKTSIEGVS